MKVKYVGPLFLLSDHSVGKKIDFRGFSRSCFMVEVTAEAGLNGTFVEGDLLVVDEERSIQRSDFVLVRVDDGYHVVKPQENDGLFPCCRLGFCDDFLHRNIELKGVVTTQVREW